MTRIPSFDGAVARLNDFIAANQLSDRKSGGIWYLLTLSHSSQALPAPKPSPVHTGHALRLNNSTEKTTPNPTPREDRITIEDMQRSHYSMCISITTLERVVVPDKIGILFHSVALHS